MFIRTRDGLPVKSISDNGGEDEVIAPPGTALPCISSPKIWSLRPKRLTA